ncbi:MAG: fatty acid desaturase family protein [Bdellovibrionota bacterium]
MAVAATDLKPLYQHRLLPNAKIPLFYALWLGLGVIAWNSTNPFLTWSCYAAMGFMQMGIVTFMHECTHSILFKARWKNTVFGMFAMIPFLISYMSFREDHLVHHRYNRSPKDPDAVFYGKRGVLDFLMFYGYCFFGVPLSLAQFGAIYAVTSLKGTKALLHWGEMIAHAVIAYFVLSWANNQGILAPVLKVWLYPFLFFGLFNSMRFIAEHYGTPYNAGQLAGTRTITSNPLTSFFWNNINWHIGHHVYPAVPWYNLQKLHQLMLADIKKANAHVDKSYVAIFVDAIFHGPESARTVALRNPGWRDPEASVATTHEEIDADLAPIS